MNKLVILAAMAAAVSVQCFAQEDAHSGSSDYQAGLRALDAQQWRAAQAAFAKAAAQMGKAADGALYWKAFAENNAGHLQAAKKTIAELQQKMPDSKWLHDAAALDAEMKFIRAPSIGFIPSFELTKSEGPDTDIKLLAINNLMMSKPAIAVPALKEVLSGKSSTAVKDRALFVLAQSSSPEAQQVVTEAAKNSGDPALQIRAIRYVGLMSRDGSQKELIAIYRSAANAEARRAVLQALAMGHGGKALADLARIETNPDRKAEIARYLFATPSDEANRYAIEVLK